MGLKPVIVSGSAFNFCKYTLALMLWVALLLQSKVLLVIALIIFIISAVVKVQRAPLVQLYQLTFGKLRKSEDVILEENSIWFAHTVGAVFTGVGLVLIQFVNPVYGWILIGILALMKTIASFGYCGAAKLYTCINNPNGQCCRVGKASKKCLNK